MRPTMVKGKKSSRFFSVRSYFDGFKNNILGQAGSANRSRESSAASRACGVHVGMVGFVKEGPLSRKGRENFNQRISAEQACAARRGKGGGVLRKLHRRRHRRPKTRPWRPAGASRAGKGAQGGKGGSQGGRTLPRGLRRAAACRAGAGRGDDQGGAEVRGVSSSPLLRHLSGICVRAVSARVLPRRVDSACGGATHISMMV